MRLPTVPLPTLSVLTSIKWPDYWVLTIANWTTLLNLLVFNSPEALLAAMAEFIEFYIYHPIATTKGSETSRRPMSTAADGKTSSNGGKNKSRSPATLGSSTIWARRRTKPEAIRGLNYSLEKS